MADDKIFEAFEKARDLEMIGYQFYTMAAALVDDPKGRAVFANLAKDELAHITVVRKIAESIKGGRGWISYEEALTEGFSTMLQGSEVFPPGNELVERLKKDQTDLNAVNIAIGNEERSVEFYTALLKNASTPTEKVVLTRLLEMEKGHLKILRWENESLTSRGFWCGDMEYSVEKERE